MPGSPQEGSIYIPGTHETEAKMIIKATNNSFHA